MTFTAVLILAVISVCMKACFTTDTAVNNKVEGSDLKLNSGEVGYFFGSLSCQHLVCVFFSSLPPLGGTITESKRTLFRLVRVGIYFLLSAHFCMDRSYH